MKSIPTKVFYLKLETKQNAPKLLIDSCYLQQITKPVSVDRYREQYVKVGKQFNWLDRIVMPDDKLYSQINAENTFIFKFIINSIEAGYAEFVIENEYVELLYFGLFPEFIGKSYGKIFLTICIEKAWSYKPQWIQLNTCELDHSNALPIYKSMGFELYKTQIEQRWVLE